jgi:TatD DNase family protein
MWTDAHCHIPHAGGGRLDLDERAIADARAAGVDRMVTIGTDVATSQEAISVAARHEGVWATVGVHPHDADGGLDGLEALLAEPGVVAVGECGLDLHYEHSPRAVQREVFAAQIALAHAHDLALVIHTREAWDETFDILAAEGVPERTVFHCFTGGEVEARRALDTGALLSFSGIITFPSAVDLRAAAALCPLERLTVETDAPYLAPVPHRGRPNTPAHVPLVGAAVAAAKGVDVAEVERATTLAASWLFRLDEGGPPLPDRR